MEKFVTMDFPVEQIRLTPLMRDEGALAAIRAISPTHPRREKIRPGVWRCVFSPEPADRPYLFAPRLERVGGRKISFTGRPAWEQIAGRY